MVLSLKCASLVLLSGSGIVNTAVVKRENFTDDYSVFDALLD